MKQAAFSVSRVVGLSRAFAGSRWRRRRLVILCYHGVSLGDEHEWNPRMYVSPETFERRLRSLARLGCNVLPLDEAVERLYRRDLPDRAVAITFDDGYHDFLACAYPRLREAGYPATVYLNTQRCEHNAPIVNLALSYLLWRGRHGYLDGDGIPGLTATRYDLRTDEARDRVLLAVRTALAQIGWTPARKDDMVRSVAERVGAGGVLERDRVLTLMRPADVAALSGRGVDFQLHTHRHRSPEDPDRFREEIVQNRQRIEAMTSVTPTHFCYPSGVVRGCYLDVLAGEGIRSATTTQYGGGRPDTNPFLLPRFVDMNHFDDTQFEAWVAGVGPWLFDAAETLYPRRPANWDSEAAARRGVARFGGHSRAATRSAMS